jgi:hypothetical protein
MTHSPTTIETAFVAIQMRCKSMHFFAENKIIVTFAYYNIVKDGK